MAAPQVSFEFGDFTLDPDRIGCCCCVANSSPSDAQDI
jgi:hypothetical protein